ncbi:MAG: hypothetical protein ACC608_10080 [Anaerofustis sp.]
MKRLINFHFKLFYRTIYLALSYLMILIITNSYLSWLLVKNAGTFDFLRYSNNVGIMALIAFMFISYEYVKKAQDINLQETLNSLENARIKIVLSQVTALLIPIALYWFNIVLYNIIVYYVRNVGYPPYLMHIFLTTILNILLVSLFACLVGVYFALKFKRIASYGIMIAIIFLMSPFFENLTFTFYQIWDINIYPLWYLISMIAPDPQSATDLLYGLPIEISRWSSSVAEIIIVLIGILWSQWGKNKKKLLVTTAFLSAAMISLIILYIQPSSIVRKDLGPSSVNFIEDRYETEENGSATDSYAIDADFEITSYVINLDISNELYADVLMTIDTSGNLDQYAFTLYRGYKITGLTTSSGEPLAFTQQGNYFTIDQSLPEPSETVHITYEGSGNKYFSNYQGISLPGYFPYYPMAGHLQLWESQSNNIFVNTDFNMKFFDVHINSKINIVSNLTESDSNHFQGNASTVSIFGGLIQNQEVAGITVGNFAVDSYDTSELSDLEQEWQSMKSLVGETSDLSFEGEKLILMPQTITSGSGSNNENFVVFEDHILVSANLILTPKVLCLAYIDSLIPYDENKYNLESIFLNYLYDGTSFLNNYTPTMPQMETLKPSIENGSYGEESMMLNITANDAFSRLFSYKVQELGEVYVLQSVYAYLTNNELNTNSIDFLYNLQ